MSWDTGGTSGMWHDAARKCYERILIFCAGDAFGWDHAPTCGDDWGGGSSNTRADAGANTGGADGGADDTCRM